MAEKVTLYYHPMCGGCIEIKPLLKEIAKRKGWNYSEVNIEDCKTKVCENLEYVPTIFMGDRKLNDKEIEALLNDKQK